MIHSEEVASQLQKLSGAVSHAARIQTTHFVWCQKEGIVLIETKREDLFHYWLQMPTGMVPVGTTRTSVFLPRAGKMRSGSNSDSFDPSRLKEAMAALQF